MTLSFLPHVMTFHPNLLKIAVHCLCEATCIWNSWTTSNIGVPWAAGTCTGYSCEEMMRVEPVYKAESSISVQIHSPFWGCKSAFPMMWNPRMPSFLMASPLVFSHFIGTDGIQFWDVGNTKEVCISFILTVQKLYILIMYRSQLCNLKLLLPISTPFQGFCIWFWIIASLKKQEL